MWLDNLVTGTFNFCTLTRNHALDGGAIYSDSAEIQLEYCLLDSNYAARNGGGIFLDEGTSVIRKSTLVNHHTGSSGAVMFATENSIVGANSSLFADNGNLPIRVADPLDREFYFCLSDEPIAMPWEPNGLPPAVNFNGDSCDSRMNLIMEPGFVNAAGRDYHLLSTSHALHAADSLLPLDADGTRADIGLFSGVRPYHVPQPFNLAYPERNASYHPGDSIVFVWNEAIDYDPGDTVTYSMWLVGAGIDTTIHTGTLRSATVRLFNGEYQWWVIAVSQRPETPRESFERRRFVVSDPALNANSGMIPLEFGVKLTGPNPFNNSTQLELALPHSADVSIVIHDVLGRETMRLQQSYAAGVHTIGVDGSTLASGVYWVTVRAGEELGRVKVMLLK
ncbi:MAG: T9SS type A sorting domain-containing protein [bacterium]|nr:T9SS type A sorting domain-containing protein [bacterium]